LSTSWRTWPAPRPRIAPEHGSDQPGYGFHHLSLSQQQTTALASHTHQGTVNDVLVAALHLAIARWNRDHGAATGRISIIVPVNFRPPQWRHEMAVNYVLISWVHTTATNRQTPQTTLETVTAQTEHIKKTGTGTCGCRTGHPRHATWCIRE
jgi:NRPS condensation-like uncharacterized protein